jgi:3-methyladenine DNA glycosylase AlkD
MPTILDQLRADLQAAIDPTVVASEKRFFKEPVKMYGNKVATVTKIARQYWQEIKHCPKSEIFTLSEELLKSDYCEEAYIVAEWLPKLTAQFELDDLLLFERWIDSYINNWAKCDGFCNHTIGNFIDKFRDQSET